jgi:hypothetical protein
MTLREFLDQYADRKFLLRGKIVDAQEVTNHYAFALDTEVAFRPPIITFVSRRGNEFAYAACALLPEEAL